MWWEFSLIPEQMTVWRWQISVGCQQTLCSYVFKISKEKIKNEIYIDNLEHVGHTRHSPTPQTLDWCQWIVLQEIYLPEELDTQMALWGNEDQHIWPKLMTSSSWISKFLSSLTWMFPHFTLWSQYFPLPSKCEHVSLPLNKHTHTHTHTHWDWWFLTNFLWIKFPLYKTILSSLKYLVISGGIIWVT